MSSTAPPVTHSSLQQRLTLPFISHIGSWSSPVLPPVLGVKLQARSSLAAPGYKSEQLYLFGIFCLSNRRDSTLDIRQIWEWIEQNWDCETGEIRTNYWAPASAFLPFKIPQISPSSQFTLYSDILVDTFSLKSSIGSVSLPKADASLVKTRLIVGTPV